MTLIEKAGDMILQAAKEIDAKQWKEIKRLDDPAEIVAIAMQSQALHKITNIINEQIREGKSE